MEVVENCAKESREPQLLETQHAMLVALGIYAQQVGLIEKVEAVAIRQKSHEHTPQRKVLEFFVAILAGLAHLKDISQAAHPIDKDEAVARAWGQSEWAHYSGVSRTLQALSESEMQAICAALDEVEQPEVEEAAATKQFWGQQSPQQQFPQQQFPQQQFPQQQFPGNNPFAGFGGIFGGGQQQQQQGFAPSPPLHSPGRPQKDCRRKGVGKKLAHILFA